jgi:predicted MPP superfamily phosphohydrolase
MTLAVEIVLFLAAWLGHAFLWTVLLNVLFSLPLHRRFLSAVRLLVAVNVLVLPPLLFLTHGPPPVTWLDDLAALHPHGVFAAYIALCWLIGVVVLPVLTVWRKLRRPPAVVVERRGQVLDIAERLGEPPVGDSKRWWIALWPGNQLFQVEFVELTLRLPRLPAALDGLTILHLTDLHFRGTPGRQFYHQVIDLCMNGGVPDLVAITGDVVDSDRHHRWVLPVLGKLRWNVAAYAVLGNHDYWHDPALVRRRLRRLGVRVLGNGWEQVTVRGEPVVVIGQEGPWFRPGPDLRDCPAGPFRLCLSHTPDYARWARRHGVDLMLAGHVHGGQIRVPVLESLFVPSWYSRKYDCGTFHEPPTVTYVSRGLAGKIPLRWNCRPEVTRITLRCV